MLPKQTEYKVGMYMRLSHDDERAGESLSIENQRTILTRYIEVGRYIDYIFPMYNIRFIALTDNVDTANTDSASMDMLPIMNVFNEWHSANTSKKLRAVFEANAKAGKYKTTVPPYGYLKGTDSKHTPVIEPTGAAVVRRIFELRAAGNNIRTIANILNADHIPVPSDHYYSLIG